MFSEPDDPAVVDRMRAAHAVASAALGAALCTQVPGGTREAWGWRGRTLGRPATGPYGPGWLRVVHSPAEKARGKLWTGPEDAERLVPRLVPRPRLHLVREWTEGDDAYRAELYDCVADGALSPSPVLTETPRLTAAWWSGLRTALGHLSTVRTERTAVRQAYLDRAMPKCLAFLDGPVPTAPPAWSTAHGDLHWANLSGPELSILDWEGWGMAPAGYDAALLHAYSLAVPGIAERVRMELSGILASDAGRFAELVVITELLQSAERGDNRELVPALRHRAEVVYRPGSR
ncbi:hypothetical protein [Streptomyces sp. b84]|uniref:hypothetical protein n=1 Tax=Streptomyces sp. b84 TaxID=1827631 RepID=UPI000BEF3395|nr:hypothetical protein [Streptomyces sp. b84]